MFPHAAIVTADVRGFTVNDCTFRDLGGNGILMKDSSTKVRICNSRFHRISMSAMLIGNHTTDWANPQNRNIDIEIINNHLHTIGYEYPAAGGIYVSIVDGLRILHNTIEKTAYSGVTVGWGWSPVSYSLGELVNIRDAEIAYNKIIDFMQLMRDGAAIYVLGANCTWDHEEQFNFMHDNYAERELYRDASKRGYYMDGSSTNWEVYDNVIFGVRLPIFSQFHVPNQYTHHNYIHDIYTDFPIDPGNHAPWRDTIVEDCYYVADREALLEEHPKARMIRDFAGCDLEMSGSNTMMFFVYIDGVEVDHSSLIKIGQHYVFDVDIPEGAKEITLYAYEGTYGGNTNDHADWTVAGFINDPTEG